MRKPTRSRGSNAAFKALVPTGASAIFRFLKIGLKMNLSYNYLGSLFEAGFFRSYERLTTMRSFLLALAALVAFSLPSSAQNPTDTTPKVLGIVTGAEAVVMELTEGRWSVRGFTRLKTGDTCNLLPGDLVIIGDVTDGGLAVKRLGATEYSLKDVTKILKGRSKTCPWYAEGIVHGSHREPWEKNYEGYEERRAQPPRKKS